MGRVIKPVKFSYSRINTFCTCGWKYKLQYEDKHYIYDDKIATEIGTLIHWIEEHIALDIMDGKRVDYDYFKKQLYEINIPKVSPTDMDGGIYGINILKEKYQKDFYAFDSNGVSYFTKCIDYAEKGIHRLENYLLANPDLEIYNVEQYCEVTYKGTLFGGYIDRIYHNKVTDEYIIEDIKTKDHLFDQKDLTTPMQFVVYNLFLQSVLRLPNFDKITCVYDLPFCDAKQPAGTKGYVARGLKKLDKSLEAINAKNFVPNPTPLCHWCPFCYTNPEQREEGKHLCCYYSLWTPTNGRKAWEKMNEWQGIDKHDIVMRNFEENQQGPGKNRVADRFDFDF